MPGRINLSSLVTLVFANPQIATRPGADVVPQTIQLAGTPVYARQVKIWAEVLDSRYDRVVATVEAPGPDFPEGYEVREQWRTYVIRSRSDLKVGTIPVDELPRAVSGDNRPKTARFFAPTRLVDNDGLVWTLAEVLPFSYAAGTVDPRYSLCRVFLRTLATGSFTELQS